MALTAQQLGAGEVVERVGVPGKPCCAGTDEQRASRVQEASSGETGAALPHISHCFFLQHPSTSPTLSSCTLLQLHKLSRGSHPVLSPSRVFAQKPILPSGRAECAPGGAFVHPFNKCFLQGAEVARLGR